MRVCAPLNLADSIFVSMFAVVIQSLYLTHDNDEEE